MILEVAERMVEIGLAAPGKRVVEEAVEECLKVMACHGAIRANQALSAEEMNLLLRQLDTCDNPSHCPHGRPTWIKWSSRTLEKSFRRIV
jgi:DNA mismatch repair protein MutL